MDRKIRVGAVSYLNTKPLIYGFEKGMMQESITLVIDYPANIAQKLIDDEIDIGLIPVAVIPKLKEYHIISDYCIGASKAVASVCLFSEVPIKEITHILVDYQSRTSAALLKILLKHHWQIKPVLIDTKDNFQQDIIGTVAGLVIGDRALVQRAHSTFIFDLAVTWREFTGLPFLFAAWVSNKILPENFAPGFEKATSEGLHYLPEIVKANPFAAYDLTTYYTKNIDYCLDAEKRKALGLFLKYIQEDQL